MDLPRPYNKTVGEVDDRSLKGNNDPIAFLKVSVPESGAKEERFLGVVADSPCCREPPQPRAGYDFPSMGAVPVGRLRARARARWPARRAILRELARPGWNPNMSMACVVEGVQARIAGPEVPLISYRWVRQPVAWY